MNEFSSEIEPELLLRILQNRAEDSEAKLFQEWIGASEENRKTFENFKKMWELTGSVVVEESPDVFKMWAAVESVTNSRNSLNQKSVAYRDIRKQDHFSWISRVAAVFLIFFLGYQLFTDVDKPVANKKTEKVFYIKVTEKGEKATIPLGDGTVVYLNAASRIKYPKYFDDDERLIEIEGQAYLDVASDKSRPFKVMVGDKVIEVVGTEFDIYNRNNKFRLVVAKGKVNTYTRESENKIGLVRGQMVTCDNIKGFSKPVTVQLDDFLAWRENKLVFKSTPLKQVLRDLEIHFNINTKINNENLAMKKLTGSFVANSLDDVLYAISISLNVGFERQGNTITIF